MSTSLKLQLELTYLHNVFLCDSFLLLIFDNIFVFFLIWLLYLSSEFPSIIFDYRITLKFLCNFAGVHKTQFPLFHEMLEWSIHRSYLVGREISALSWSLHMWHPVTAGIKLFLIVLSQCSSKWQKSGMVFRK